MLYKNSKCADDPPSDGCAFSSFEKQMEEAVVCGWFRIMTRLQEASRPTLQLPLINEPEDYMYMWAIHTLRYTAQEALFYLI